MKSQAPPSYNGRNSQKVALLDHAVSLLRPGLRLVLPQIHHCEPGWSWSPSPFRDFDLWLVFSGRGGLETRGRSYALERGSGFLFQPGDTLRAHHDPADPLLVFSCHFLSAQRPSGRRRVCREVLYARLEDLGAWRRDAELAARVFAQGPSGRLLADTILAQLVAHFFHAWTTAGETGPHDPKLDLLALEIRSSPGAPRTVRDMARFCALSIPHFNRKFREAFGMAPRHYVIHQKILRAASLLRESSMPIQQIAASLGYSDVFFFHRQFRRMAGATPRAVRLGAETAWEG